MSRTIRPCLLLCAVVVLLQAPSSSLQAGIIFFTNEAAFDAAAPSLMNQNFASATLPPIGLAVIGNPLNNATNNAVFASGSILPGLSFFSSASHGGQDLGVVATGVFGNPAKAVYNNFSNDSLDIGFGPSSVAVGMGVLNPNGSSVKVTVLGPGGTTLASQTFTVPSNGGEQFIGAIATGGDAVGQINLLGIGTQAFAGVDRVSFASPAAIPEPGSLVLGGLSAAVALILGASRRTRKNKPREAIAA